MATTVRTRTAQADPKRTFANGGAYGGPTVRGTSGTRPDPTPTTSTGFTTPPRTRQQAWGGGALTIGGGARTATTSSRAGGPAGRMFGGDSPWNDQSRPGVAETGFGVAGADLLHDRPLGEWADENQDRVQAAGPLATLYPQLVEGYANRPKVSNNAQSAYAAYQANKPTIAQDPGLGAFYDRAIDRTVDRLGTEFAARGAYGSSVAQGQVGDAVANLEAERANREADYHLNRLAEQRAWEGQGLDAARASDISSAVGSQSELGWMHGAADVAGSADRAGLSRLLAEAGIMGNVASEDFGRINSFMDAASTSQGFRDRRIQNSFQNLIGALMPLMGVANSTYGAMIGGDQAAFDSVTGMPIAAASDALAGAQQADANTANLLGTILLLNYAGAFGGGGAAVPGAATASGTPHSVGRAY